MLVLINWITLIHHTPQSRKLDKIGNKKAGSKRDVSPTLSE